jgi:hypothetical protein
MNRKIIIGCIGSVILLILVTFSSVVGSQTTQSSNKFIPSSPLFNTRTIRSINKKAPEIKSNYLGKGNYLNLFPLKKSLNEDMFNKAMEIISKNPALLIKLFDNMENFPYFRELLNKYDVNKFEVKNYLRILMDNPSLLSKEMKNIQIAVPNVDSPQPRGLSTSSALGCFIVALIVLPIITVVIALVALVFTLRILTCLNVNDCAEIIAQDIWDQLVQGLILT